MYKLVLLSLFFAAASAGYLGAPAVATYAAAPAVATYAAAPAIATYAAAPAVHAAPLATSYANTYKVSVKTPVVAAAAPLAYAAPAVHAAPLAYAAPAVHAAPLAYGATTLLH